MLKKIKKHKWELLFFIAICLVGIFLRTYNFGPWLHFEVDQSWDYRIVSNAIIDGPSNLPLLGPTSGGGRALRLGPAFYYMEYLSAILFGNSPAGHAMLVLIFSLLTLPLFYLFVRKYFSMAISLGLLIIASTSLYLIMYSRFSWSPNVLPFLIMLSFFAILKSVAPHEKNSARWFLIAIGAVSLTTQIHFNAFFVIPAVIISFLLIKRPKFPLKIWLAAFAIVFLVYLPMLANEIKTNGENTRFFLKKVEKTTDHQKTFIEKISLNIQYEAYEYFLIISGSDQINGKLPEAYNLNLTCKNDCMTSSRIPLKILALLLFAAGVFLLALKLKNEQSGERKDFLTISLLWFLFSVSYFFKIYDSNTLFPRFFLLVSPLAIIFLGFILESIKPEKNKPRLALMIIVVLLLTWGNINKTLAYFSQLKNVSTINEDVKLKDVFPFTQRATLQLEKQVADYMAAKIKENDYPVFIQCDHEYASLFWYLLNQRNIDDSVKIGPATAQGNYFLIVRGKIDPHDVSKTKGFTIRDARSFGSLTVYSLQPELGAIIEPTMENSAEYVATQHAQISELMTWKKLFEPYAPAISAPQITNDTSDTDESLGQ